MLDSLPDRVRATLPAVDFCSVRFVRTRSQEISVRSGVLQPVRAEEDTGAMVVVHEGGGAGYAATSDLSDAGLAAAIETARGWARRSAPFAILDYSAVAMPHPVGRYESPVTTPWSSMSLADKIGLLRQASEGLAADPRIVDREATLWWTQAETRYITNRGGDVRQTQHLLVPTLSVAANDGKDTVERTLGGRGLARQGGLELLDSIDFVAQARSVAHDALALLAAPNCPTLRGHLLLKPDQMMLQIHESIGHPLELDRILGDERNYAGTSFVTPDMFGRYRYGSELLNVTYDPTVPNQYASFGFDDDGVHATRQHLIQDGILMRPLGSVISQHRAGMEGVANARATSWNRPAIDRMANLNVEPGTSTMEELIGSVERGVLMEANVSWSIDDSRNKFQFGCEMGRLIEDGELGALVRKPNYRGISATFWRNLVGVGDHATNRVLGTPFCGKGEPNQTIRVGHASPACLFADVEIFGGA